MYSVIIFCVVSVIIDTNSAAGFTYPDEMPPPKDAQSSILGATVPFILEHETSIQIRITSTVDATFWNCLASYDSKAFDILTKQAPLVRADDATISEYGTSETRMLCSAFATLIVMNHIMPESVPSIQEVMDSFTLDSSIITVDSEVAQCDVTDASCLQSIASDNDYTPEIMAAIIAYQVIDYLDNDGWNGDGSIGIDGTECTANCRPYSDFTGYEPKTGDFNRWQPLLEDNGKGFSYFYNHITPHIGQTAVTKFTCREDLEGRSAPDPEYDYKEETEKVIERLADLAVDDKQKMLVEFFDDKLSVASTIFSHLDVLLNWTFEERVFFAAGYTAAEYDGVIASWKEKRKWDMVRPTTLIKRGEAGDTVETYGGPFQGLQTIKAQDFESYIRVMPHSEYPSGSGCICLVAAEFVDTLLNEKYGITDSISVDVPFPDTPFVNGSSKIEPGVTPKEDIYVTMKNMDELVETCGVSRLWGGMHFTQSVPGSYELCKGLGTDSYWFMTDLLEGNAEALGARGSGKSGEIKGDEDNKGKKGKSQKGYADLIQFDESIGENYNANSISMVVIFMFVMVGFVSCMIGLCIGNFLKSHNDAIATK